MQNDVSNVSFIAYPIIDTIVLISKNNTNWFESPLFSGLFGVVVGFVLTSVRDYFKGKKELAHYEYLLLSNTKDILENSKIKIENIDKFVDEIYPDLRSSKLESSEIIFDALLKARKGEDFSHEKGKIGARLEVLRKDSLISRTKSLFK